MSDCNLNNIRYLPPTNRRNWYPVFIGNPSLQNDFKLKSKEENTETYEDNIILEYDTLKTTNISRWKRSSSIHKIEYYHSRYDEETAIWKSGSSIIRSASTRTSRSRYFEYNILSEDGRYTIGKALEPSYATTISNFNRSWIPNGIGGGFYKLVANNFWDIKWFPSENFYTSLRQIVCNNERIIGYEMFPDSGSNASSRTMNNCSIVTNSPYENGIIKRYPFSLIMAFYHEDIWTNYNSGEEPFRSKMTSYLSGGSITTPNPPSIFFGYHYPMLSLLNKAYFSSDGIQRDEPNFNLTY